MDDLEAAQTITRGRCGLVQEIGSRRFPNLKVLSLSLSKSAILRRMYWKLVYEIPACAIQNRNWTLSTSPSVRIGPSTCQCVLRKR
jgi:hypothetical protein